MLCRKVIKCKIHSLTKNKENILNHEYDDFNHLCRIVQRCRDNDIEPDYFWFKNDKRYGRYIQQAIRIILKQHRKLNEQPLYLRNDRTRIDEKDTKISKHWLNLPTKAKYGGVWLPLIVPRYAEKLLKHKLCDSKIVRRKGKWYAHITVKYEVEIRESYSNAIALDIGHRYIATACGSWTARPMFHGRNVKGIRRHYRYLRKKLGEKKLLRKINQIGHTEHNKVNDQLHKISKDIVEQAEQHNAYIIVGDLKNLKGNTGKGRRFNRIVNSMPYNKLTLYIEYKANDRGIKVVKVSEAYTSQCCSKCGHTERANRRTQGFFKCRDCGFEINADANASRNILSSGYTPEDGAFMFKPKIQIESGKPTR